MAIQLLVDGDWILYTAGFACQHNEYVAFARETEDSPPDLYGPFDSKATIKEQGFFDVGAVFARTWTDPIDHTLHTVKQMLASASATVAERFRDDVNIAIYLDGDGNFRNRLPALRPYKGNRLLSPKPLMYLEIRDYLESRFPCFRANGLEADDLIAIHNNMERSSGNKPVMCCVDKDMLQVPGWHYNPNKGFKHVNKHGGLLFQYRQCLTGDASDNIPGAYKIGPKKAAQIVTNEMRTEKEMWDAVVSTYDQTIEQHGDVYSGKTGIEAARINMNLVYLMRDYDDVWKEPT